MEKNKREVISQPPFASSSVLKKANAFLANFSIFESEHGIDLLLNFDLKSKTYYVVCHLDGSTLVKNCDTNAVLDADDEEYKLNRDLSLDKYAYRLMEADAINGRSFEDIVIEYDLSYRKERPLKVYGGQHRIEAITNAYETHGVSVIHGCRIYFDLTRDQKVEIATVNNTSIAVPSDLLDRMQEDQLGSELRDWCQNVGLLGVGQNFSDRSASDLPTVRLARTLLTNFYLGKDIVENENKFYQPVLCASGPGVDRNYETIRNKIIWDDRELFKMGQEFARLHKLQMERVNSRKQGKNTAAARKALSLALVASWAYASGFFQKKPAYLLKHYALASGVSPSDDPLNSNALSQARLKGKDKDNYRGLGTRVAVQSQSDSETG